jgi:cytochrome bd-type quinol oxidase subunit 1
MHFVAAVLVAVGTLSSSFWILAINNWMQNPVGYEVIDGRFFPKDWFEIIFSPSFPYRRAHTVSAFHVTTAFVGFGAGAYMVRQGPLRYGISLRQCVVRDTAEHRQVTMIPALGGSTTLGLWSS